MMSTMRRLPVALILTLACLSLIAIFTNRDYISASDEISPIPNPTATPLRIAVPRQGHPSSFTVDDWNSQPPTHDESRLFLRGKNKQANRVLNFMKERKMLIGAGISFNPDILLAKNWQEILQRNYPNFFDSKSSVWLANGKLKGTIIADQVFLRKDTKLEGDTVILARRLVFEGRNVSIKGPYNIAIYTVEGNVTTMPVDGIEKPGSYSAQVNTDEFETQFFARNTIQRSKPVSFSAGYDFVKDPQNHIRSRLPSPTYKGNRFISRGVKDGRFYAVFPAGFIEIDTSGPGNKEWKESRRDGVMTSNANGAPGANGSYPQYPQGTRGTDGGDGTVGGQDGSCLGSISGTDGEDGQDGTEGQEGENAPDDAGDGADGQSITLTINTAEENAINYSARGGDGGNGQNGAIGGNGGNGGRGKRGGNGTTCGCQVGNGGKSGDAGKGGNAGSGGNGGKAGSGGNGGSISITYAPHLITPTGDVSKGRKGIPGQGGVAGTPGIGGAGWNGGNPGSPSCGIFGLTGQLGATGANGNASNLTFSGSDGEDGQDGSVDIQPLTGGGGGGPTYCELYPSACGGGPSCTPYFWVYYISWDNGVTWEYQSSEYAGCW